MTFDPASGSGIPDPAAVSTDDKNWGVIAHLSGFVCAWFALGIIGPTIVYFLKGQSSPFARAHAVEAVNFNITVLIGLLVSGVLVLVGIGVIFIGIIGILYLVCTILGAMAAKDGKLYRYPVTFRFIS
jgi:uncharacterized Tic20 family protein